MRTKTLDEVSELVENEWYIVRDSGEIPEIAYNSAIYYLTRAASGPRVTLTDVELCRLKQAAVERYQEIILRDMLHENVGKSIYRGIARSIYNFDRFAQFCKRQSLDPEPVRMSAKEVLTEFLQNELVRVSDTHSTTVINCSFPELLCFAKVLGVPSLSEYSAFEMLCPDSEEL